MTDIISCPSCQTRLRVPQGGSSESYTCPRCLGEIRLSTSSDIATEPSRQRPVEVGRCFSCDATIDNRDWRFCPRCSAPLRNEDRPAAQRYVDDDFQRDRRRTGWFTISLMVLGILAISLTAFGVVTSGDTAALATVIFCLTILSAIVWGVVYWRTRSRPEEMTVARVAKGVAATVGVFVLGYMVIAVSVFVFFLAVCWGHGCR